MDPKFPMSIDRVCEGLETRTYTLFLAFFRIVKFYAHWHICRATLHFLFIEGRSTGFQGESL